MTGPQRGRSIRTAVPVDHPSLPGHFPGTPIVPGVFLLALAAAKAATLLGRPIGPSGVTAVKFLRPVRPGEPLVIEVVPAGGTSAASVRFEVRVDGAVAASGTLRFDRAPL